MTWVTTIVSAFYRLSSVIPGDVVVTGSNTHKHTKHTHNSGYWKYCTRFEGTPVYVLKWVLPPGFTCDRCILQW